MGVFYACVENTRNVLETNDTSNFLFGGVALPFFLQKTHDMWSNYSNLTQPGAPKKVAEVSGNPRLFQGNPLTLPETNSSPLKIDGLKTTFLLGFGLFSGVNSLLVSGRVLPCQAGDAQMGSRILARVAEGVEKPWVLKKVKG